MATEMATWSDINIKCGTNYTPTNKCPTAEQINAKSNILTSRSGKILVPLSTVSCVDDYDYTSINFIIRSNIPERTCWEIVLWARNGNDYYSCTTREENFLEVTLDLTNDNTAVGVKFEETCLTNTSESDIEAEFITGSDDTYTFVGFNESIGGITWNSDYLKSYVVWNNGSGSIECILYEV